MNTRHPACLLVLAIAIANLAAPPVLAQGRMTSRPAPPRPPTSQNGCMLESVSGWPGDRYRIKRRAEDAARDQWKAMVRRTHGDDFARWKLSNPHTRQIECKDYRNGYACWAKATPCDGSEPRLYDQRR
ncbi:hypothetical protein [Marilutibacter spongiae]|uniref:Uncharacterized protein n=1 Tax=Marilutibacter spongiae TaxID=2025720 RepID=A0A7W3TPG6_9GAMM|nr:hypothetical protein [Lysobacter spongiae]MBB1061839.1 hypothetical protein [Lysobacter spongiae]